MTNDGRSYRTNKPRRKFVRREKQFNKNGIRMQNDRLPKVARKKDVDE